MSLTTEDIKRIEELLELANKNDIFTMTTRECSEFECNILNALYEQLGE